MRELKNAKRSIQRKMEYGLTSKREYNSCITDTGCSKMLASLDVGASMGVGA